MKKVGLKFLVFAALAVAAVFTSCEEEVKVKVPELTTTEVSEFTTITAKSGGNITDDGGAEVTARGVCWGTSANPTVSGNKTSDGSGKGSFTSTLSSLVPSTEYFVRAYATNSEGTSYGNEVSFTTLNAEHVQLLDTSEDDDTGSYNKYEYDSQNRITKISWFDKANGDFYNTTKTFFYNGNDLVKTVEKGQWHDDVTIEYVKNGNKINISEDHGNDNIFTYTLDLNDDGYPIKYTGYNDYYLGNVQINYQYKDGNLIKETWDVYTSSFDYKYDNNKSPFYHCKTHKWYLILYEGYGNHNNVIEKLEGDWKTEYTYEYDSAGFPTKITSSDSKDNVYILKYK